MAKKKNYSKKAGGAGLMAAISDYQRENKQKETYKPKNTPKLDSNKAKNNTSQAYGSGKNFGAMLKKDPPKRQTPQTPPRQEKPPETRQLTNGGSDGPKRITPPYRSRAQGLAAEAQRKKDKGGNSNSSGSSSSSSSGRPPSSQGTTDKTRRPGYYTIPGKGRRYWNGKKWTTTQAGSNPMYGQAKRGLKKIAEGLWGKDK